MDLGKSIEQYLATNIFYILPTALAWIFFIEVFKQILKNHNYVDITVERVERLLSKNKSAAVLAALVFLAIAYRTVFRHSNSASFDIALIVIVGLLSISLFAATRVPQWGKSAFGTGSWFETALTAWMMMLFALFIVYSTLGLIIHFFPNVLN